MAKLQFLTLILFTGLLRAGSAPNSLSAPAPMPGTTAPESMPATLPASKPGSPIPPMPPAPDPLPDDSPNVNGHRAHPSDPAYQWTQIACTNCTLIDAAPAADGESMWLALAVAGENGGATQHRLRQVDHEGRLLGDRTLSLSGTGAIRRLLAVADVAKGPLVLFSDSAGAIFSGRPDGAGKLDLSTVIDAKQKATVTRLIADGSSGFYFIGRRGNDGLAGRLDVDGRPLWLKALRWKVEAGTTLREGIVDGWCDGGGDLHMAGESAAATSVPGSLWLGTLNRAGELSMQENLGGRPLAYAPGGEFAGIALAPAEPGAGWQLLGVGGGRTETLRAALPGAPFYPARMAGLSAGRWLLTGVSDGACRALILNERGVPAWDHRPGMPRSFAALPVPQLNGFFLVFEYEVRLADGKTIHQVDLRKIWERRN